MIFTFYPIIDIGSNTVKIAVFDTESPEVFTPVFFKSAHLRLISQRENGILSDDAVDRLINVINSFVSLAELKGIDTPPYAFATASLRGLKNTRSVLSALKKYCGINAQILSGAQEAYYSFKGVSATENTQEGLMADLGGGSTEFLSFSGGIPVRSHSFNFGFVKLAEKYYTLGPNAFADHVMRKLDSQDHVKNNRYPLYFIGGSAKAVCDVKKAFYGGQDTLTADELYKLHSSITQADEKTAELIKARVGERAFGLEAAVIFFYCVVNKANKKIAVVSRGGVREGYAGELMKKNRDLI